MTGSRLDNTAGRAAAILADAPKLLCRTVLYGLAASAANFSNYLKLNKNICEKVKRLTLNRKSYFIR